MAHDVGMITVEVAERFGWYSGHIEVHWLIDDGDGCVRAAVSVSLCEAFQGAVKEGHIEADREFADQKQVETERVAAVTFVVLKIHFAVLERSAVTWYLVCD